MSPGDLVVFQPLRIGWPAVRTPREDRRLGLVLSMDEEFPYPRKVRVLLEGKVSVVLGTELSLV